MKKCPFCAESIQDEAIKCRFCGENVSVDVMTKAITADHITQQSSVINALLATKSKQDQNKAKLVLQELICQIKDAPNRDAFLTELKNAEDSYQKLGGSLTEVLSTQEKLKQDSDDQQGCWWVAGVLLFGLTMSSSAADLGIPSWALWFSIAFCFGMAGSKTVVGVGVVTDTSGKDQTS